MMTTPVYYHAYAVVPILTLAILFRGISSNTGVGIGISGKTEYHALAIGLTAIANIGLNFLLIPPYGMIGAAIATLLSFILWAFANYKISYRFFPIRYEFSRIIKIAFATAMPMLIHYFLRPESMVQELVLDVVLCLCYFILLLTLKFFKPDEIIWLKEQWHNGRIGLSMLATKYTRT